MAAVAGKPLGHGALGFWTRSIDLCLIGSVPDLRTRSEQQERPSAIRGLVKGVPRLIRLGLKLKCSTDESLGGLAVNRSCVAAQGNGSVV